MLLEHIHSYLVHPAKADAEPPKIGGTKVGLDDRLASMLSTVFSRATEECKIEIVFRPDSSGNQKNPCRDEIVAYLEKATLARGRKLAARLQAVTTHRSKLGLFFLMTGRDGATRKLVMSRFPADQGVIAEEDSERLSVEFIERVFMKSAKAYKSAVYQSDSLERGFWDGRAIDRQVSGARDLSDYWIRDFLVSDLRTTGPLGTKRVAVALRGAIREADKLEVRQELVAAATLMRNQDGYVASAREQFERLALTEPARELVNKQLPREELLDESFRFDREEFDRHVAYRLVELDNGAMLVAEDRAFEAVFEREELDPEDGLVRFATEGHVVDEQLRRSK